MSTTQSKNFPALTFIDSNAARNKPEFYTPVTLNLPKIIESWALSVFSYEWIDPKSGIKPIEALKPSDQEKRQTVEQHLTNNTPLEKPVLGIGIQDNVEIGSGRAVICTLAAHGFSSIPAHIPISNLDDFKPFLAQS